MHNATAHRIPPAIVFVTRYGERRKVRAMATGMKSGVEKIKGSEPPNSEPTNLGCSFHFHRLAELPSSLRRRLPIKADTLVNNIGM